MEIKRPTCVTFSQIAATISIASLREEMYRGGLGVGVRLGEQDNGNKEARKGKGGRN